MDRNTLQTHKLILLRYMLSQISHTQNLCMTDLSQNNGNMSSQKIILLTLHLLVPSKFTVTRHVLSHSIVNILLKLQLLFCTSYEKYQ